ncbi:hypothetical protein FRC11_006400 [Ceratobasidium sp. 423]|nr:hypothetical protein FRC11_006400 [Ceratobasidium sp. 423]
MPCSTRNPESGFTFRSLRMFDLFSADAKLSASRYHAVLQRQNNNIEPHTHQHRLRELLRVSREWTFLQALKRAGRTVTDPVQPGSLSVRCPACPRLNFNYKASDIEEDKRYLFAQQLSYDGSFQLVRKNKAHDQFDICLTDGLMYWVKQDDYKAHLMANKDTAYNQHTHRGAEADGGDRCNNHRAANDTWVKRSGVAETGLGAVTCARHTLFMPIGAVSYWKGERFGYTDFSAACQIWLLMSEGATEIGFFYDIYCQWIKYFWDRAPRIVLPNGPLERPERFFGGVPKYHLAGHVDSCYALYSLNNMHGAGRLDTEGCEHAWANLNGALGSTSEKGPGAQVDSLNHIMNDWNWRKFVTMITLALKKLTDAEKMASECKHAWVILHDSLKPVLTQAWEAMSTQPRLVNKNAARFLDITLTEAELLSPIAEETDGQPEYATLYLPSQLGKQVMRMERSLRVIDLEITLRRAECYETLRRVRTACMQKSQMITGKNKHAQGEIANTRAQTMISRLTTRVDNAIADYNRSFNALKQLAGSEHLRPFQELLKTHFNGLDRILRPDREGGEGRKMLPWFWTVRDNDSRSDKEAEEEEYNEEWFRGRERYRRWEEEVLWLRREIASTLFSYYAHSDEWMSRSQSNYAELNEGYKSYCLRQSDLYLGLMISGYQRVEHVLKASPPMPICERAVSELSGYVARGYR